MDLAANAGIYYPPFTASEPEELTVNGRGESGVTFRTGGLKVARFFSLGYMSTMSVLTTN